MTKAAFWDSEILRYLNDGAYHGPNEIGLYIGKRHGNPQWHSAWASPKLKRLEREGYVEANEQRHYRITPAGCLRLSQLLIEEFPTIWLRKTSQGWRWNVTARINRSDSHDGIEREARLYGAGKTRQHCLEQIEEAKPKVVQAWIALGGVLPEGYSL